MGSKAVGAAPGRHRIALTALVLLGVCLRVLNVGTAVIHRDEVHYADDASWSLSPLPLPSALRFLREHPHVHLRLNPATGEMTPWPTTGPNLLGGHLTLHAYVTGLVLAIVRPGPQPAPTMVARLVNAIADSATIVLLPPLVVALGGGTGAGLAAAALYAVFPPAIVYGSIANLDPFLAPLLVALLVLVLHPGDVRRRWLLAGVVTGLLVCAKQPGLVALGLVPLLAWRDRRGPHLGGLAIWALVAALVVVALVSPAAYLEGLSQPSDPYVQLRFQPFDFLIGNLEWLARPSTWYWLSFSYHGRPLAFPFAHVHQVVTPVYLVAYALALPALALRGRWRAVLALFGPTLFLLCFIQPSNGTSRFHMAAPLVCAAIALAAGSISRRARVALALGAVVMALAPLVPATPGAAGALDLGDLLFWNPQAQQAPTFFSPWQGRSPYVRVQAGLPLSRHLWLPPGDYEVDVVADGPVDVTLDGRPIVEGGATRGPLAVGRFPRLEVSTPTFAKLRSIVVRPGARSPAARG